MEKKLEIVRVMVKAGYCLFGEAEEHFTNRCTLEMLEMFCESFLKYKK